MQIYLYVYFFAVLGGNFSKKLAKQFSGRNSEINLATTEPTERLTAPHESYRGCLKL